MSEAVGHQLGNFFGEFVSYDPKNDSSIWRECMRIKIRLDVRKPLKRKKKIKRRNGSEFVVSCKYERLGDFCFACGLVTHTERFCRKSLDTRSEGGVQEWGSWLRAQTRRGAGQGGSKWLREEDDVGWTERIGRENNCPTFQGGKSGVQDMGSNMRRDSRSSEGENSKLVPLRITQGGNSNVNEPNFSLISNGLYIEEEVGLNIEERKRKRIGPISNTTMDTDDKLSDKGRSDDLEQHKEALFSEIDYTVSNKNGLATLAGQASLPLGLSNG